LSDPGPPPLDWDGVFDRAHRRLYIRLTVLAAVGGLVALLLLGGGLTARGVVRIGPLASKKTKGETGTVKLDRKVTATLERLAEPPPSPPPPKSHRHKTPPPPPPPEPPPPPTPEPPEPCGGDSASKQYEECPPGPTGPTGATGGTGATGYTGYTENGGTEYVAGTPPTTTPGLSKNPETVNSE
jgi:hypothetical protein